MYMSLKYTVAIVFYLVLLILTLVPVHKAKKPPVFEDLVPFLSWKAEKGSVLKNVNLWSVEMLCARVFLHDF